MGVRFGTQSVPGISLNSLFSILVWTFVMRLYKLTSILIFSFWCHHIIYEFLVPVYRINPPPQHTPLPGLSARVISLWSTHKPSLSNLNSGEQKGLYYTYKKGSVTMLLNSSVIYTCTEWLSYDMCWEVFLYLHCALRVIGVNGRHIESLSVHRVLVSVH